MSSMPAATSCSTMYCMTGLSTTGNISLGIALVCGKKRVPKPAAAITALVTLAMVTQPFPYSCYELCVIALRWCGSVKHYDVSNRQRTILCHVTERRQIVDVSRMAFAIVLAGPE